MNVNWQERQRPARLERRYEFVTYSDLSHFLERAADLSERSGLYPDLGFGKDYVNVTIHADRDTPDLLAHHHEFAEQLEQLKTAMSTGQE